MVRSWVDAQLAAALEGPVSGQPVPTTRTRMVVGPGTAATWMQANTKNRHLRGEWVEDLIREMQAGRWRYTGDPIKFDTDGHLIDGQHRLAAVILSGVPIEVAVEPGLLPPVQDVLDSGIKRKAADVLTLRGEANANRLAAVARLALEFDTNRFTTKITVTHQEILAWVEAHPEARDACSSSGHYLTIPMSPAVVAYGLWHLRTVDQDAADDFFSDLAWTRTSGAGDPRAALLQRLNSAKISRELVPRAALVSMLFRTWNAVRKGQTMLRIQATAPGGVLIDVPDPI